MLYCKWCVVSKAPHTTSCIADTRIKELRYLCQVCLFTVKLTMVIFKNTIFPVLALTTSLCFDILAPATVATVTTQGKTNSMCFINVTLLYFEILT